jgi:putative transposase
MMKRSRFSDEQISYTLRQVEGGTAVADACREVGISEATFYIWERKYAHLARTEVQELRQLREENPKLKRLVADLAVDKHMMAEILRKEVEAGTQARARGMDAGCLQSDPYQNRHDPERPTVRGRNVVA